MSRRRFAAARPHLSLIVLVAALLTGDAVGMGIGGRPVQGSVGDDPVVVAAATTPTPEPAPTADPGQPDAEPPDPLETPLVPVADGTPGPRPTDDAGCLLPPEGLVEATVVRHGDRERPHVALTFDDGWDPDQVRELLAILQRDRVNATFFPTGVAVKRDPDVWRDVAAAGFPIGNHTYNHPNLMTVCFDRQVRELGRADDALRSLLGIEPLPVMRPPYGLFDRSTRLALAVLGISDLVLWDVDARDWSGNSKRDVVARATAGQNGSIVVLHTSPENTVRALPAIIATYRKRGFEFVTLGTLLGIGGSVPFP